MSGQWLAKEDDLFENAVKQHIEFLQSKILLEHETYVAKLEDCIARLTPHRFETRKGSEFSGLCNSSPIDLDAVGLVEVETKTLRDLQEGSNKDKRLSVADSSARTSKCVQVADNVALPFTMRAKSSEGRRKVINITSEDVMWPGSTESMTSSRFRVDNQKSARQVSPTRNGHDDVTSYGSGSQCRTTSSAPSSGCGRNRSTESSEVSKTALQEWKKHLLDLFKKVDQDSSGFIQIEEMRHAVRSMNKHPNLARKLIVHADRNGDGQIDFHEWEHLIDDIVTGVETGKASDFVRLLSACSLRKSIESTKTRLERECCDCGGGVGNVCIFDHRSIFRMCWDLFLTLSLIYIAVQTPFEIGFIPSDQKSAELTTIDSIVNTIFVIDIIMCFRTTYQNTSGILIRNPKKIACHYLRTWFLIDVLSSFPFEAAFSSGVMADFDVVAKGGKFFKILKVLRLIKVTEFTHSSAFLESVHDYFALYGNEIPFTVCAYSFGAFLLCHWLACFLPCAGGGFLREYSWDEPSMFSQYSSAVYWAVSTITTVGYGDIVPTSNGERMYAIFSMFVGGAFYGAVVGKASVIINKRNLNAQTYRDRLSEVRAWMKHHELSPWLRHRVWRYFKAHLAVKSASESFSILHDLSPELGQIVAEAIVHEEVRSNPLFQDSSTIVLVRLANIMKKTFAEPLERIASHGDYGCAMFVLTVGNAVIDRRGTRLRTHEETLAVVQGASCASYLHPSDSFGEEIILGIQKVYKYNVVAVSHVTMLMIPSDEFTEQFGSMHDLMQQMRQNFVGGSGPSKVSASVLNSSVSFLTTSTASPDTSGRYNDRCKTPLHLVML